MIKSEMNDMMDIDKKKHFYHNINNTNIKDNMYCMFYIPVIILYLLMEKPVHYQL